VAEKWDYGERRTSVGGPRVPQEIVDLVLPFARENPLWGYDRIQGALANVGHSISDQTVPRSPQLAVIAARPRRLPPSR